MADLHLHLDPAPHLESRLGRFGRSHCRPGHAGARRLDDGLGDVLTEDLGEAAR